MRFMAVSRRLSALNFRAPAHLNSQSRFATTGYTDVCFLDPKLPYECKDRLSIGAVSLRLPDEFLPELSRGHFSLGEADEPSNTWSFGELGREMFEYRFVGRHPVRSGLSGAIPRSVLDSLHGPWRHIEDKPDVDKVLAEQGFLFVGKIVNAGSASVYALEHGGGRVTSIIISSDAEEEDAP